MPSGPCMMKAQTPPGRNSKVRVVVVNPFGPQPRPRCAGSVNASNTSRRGPWMVREMMNSRSAAIGLLFANVIAVLLALKLLHVLVEPVEALAPELFEPADPLVDRLQAARVEAVEPVLTHPTDAHEAHLSKHAQVLGCEGRCHP